MDVRKRFRNLVTNIYMPDFDYVNEVFSFQTVFYKTPYSYCCCSCAFDHEFLEYLTDSGEINEALYDKIIQSLVDGVCPHAEKASDKYHARTSITGLHVAVALSTREALEQCDPNLYQKSRIFDQRCNSLVFLKYRNNHAQLLYIRFIFEKLIKSNMYEKEDDILRITVKQPCNITVAQIPVLDAYVDILYKISLLGRVMLLPYTSPRLFYGALDVSIKQNLTEAQDLLLSMLFEFEGYFIPLMRCLESAIVYDRSKTLAKMLDHFPYKYRTSPSIHSLSKICILLNREECMSVLSTYGLFIQTDISDVDKITRLLKFFDSHHDDFKSEIIKILNDIPEIQRGRICKFLVRFVTSKPKGGHKMVKTILELGPDVDWSNEITVSLIEFILGNLNMYDYCARETFKLLINENPDLKQMRTAVHLGLQQDANLKTLKMKKLTLKLSGNYQTDIQEHGLFGHNDACDFALNFVGPFLIECGFPTTRGVLLEALDKDHHPSELAYLRRCLDNPRSLIKICRDTLRAHFNGRRIHKFVKVVGCPVKICDLILMKSLLENKEN